MFSKLIEKTLQNKIQKHYPPFYAEAQGGQNGTNEVSSGKKRFFEPVVKIEENRSEIAPIAQVQILNFTLGRRKL